jgi:repressor LexA
MLKVDPDKLKMYFGKRLKKIRTENGYNQEQVASIIGANKSTISRYENGISSPGVSEVSLIADKFNVNFYWLAGMSEEKYRLKRELVKVPIVGRIACGLPLLAEENIIDYEYAERNENIDFALIAKGSSMINARIFDGDIVFIRRQNDVEDGEIAAVLIDDEATLKRVYKLNGDLLLKSENPIMDDIRISAKDRKNVIILGKAIAFKSNLR